MAAETEKTEADIAEIMRLIPHRYPFLLIDRVEQIDVFKSAVGIKNVTVNEPFFPGHFPGKPIMPGVLIVEAMAQTAAITVAKGNDQGGDNNILVYFMSVDNCKFRSPVTPGDQLSLHVEVIRGRGKIWRFACQAKVGDRLAAEAEITAMMFPRDEA